MNSEESKSSGGPNWLLGADKLTTPTLEFLGFKIRDTIRSYLNSKARERAAVRKFEREFFIRQGDLLYYGADQFALTFPALEKELLDRTFARFESLMKAIAEEGAIDPTRALEVVTSGFIRRELKLESAHEIALFQSAASILDTLVATYSAQVMFHYCLVPSTVHRQDPEVSDDELDALMNNPDTMEQIQEEIDTTDHPLSERIARIVCRAYEIPYPDDEKKD